MTEFQAQIRGRIREAVASLEAARDEGDDYMVDVRTGELESLRRVATDHDVSVPEVAVLDGTVATSAG